MNEIVSIARRERGLEIIMLSEISQTEEEKYHMFCLICGT
jgi:hypothetical protein